MADYPGSVFSPATINNGETVDASHQNEPNDEINAIETALVNGEISHDLTPSSGSTRSLGSAGKPWLQIHVGGVSSSGASTLGNVTVANLQVTGGSSGITQDYAQVFASTVISISTAIATVLEFDSQRSISNSSMHSTGTNPSRLTAQSSGFYHIVGNVELGQPASSNHHSLELFLNSTTTIAGQSNRDASASIFSLRENVSALRNLDDGDFVEVRFRTEGSTRNIKNSDFSMAKL